MNSNKAIYGFYFNIRQDLWFSNILKSVKVFYGRIQGFPQGDLRFLNRRNEGFTNVGF